MKSGNEAGGEADETGVILLLFANITDGAEEVAVCGLMALVFLQLGQGCFFLTVLSFGAVRVLGQQQSLVLCAMLSVADLGCSWASSFTMVKMPTAIPP